MSNNSIRDEHTDLAGLFSNNDEMEERILRQSEQFNQEIIDSLSAHIAVVDRDGVITNVNEAWRRFAVENGADWTMQGIGVGSNYLNVCRRAQGDNAAEAATIYQGLADVLSGAKDFFTMEYPCHSPSQERWFLLTVSPLAHSGGAVVSHQNVTERRLAENAVRESEEKYRTLFDSIDEGFCVIELIYDESGRVVDWLFVETNPTFERQSGFQGVGRTAREIVGEVESYWFEFYARVAATGQPERMEDQVKAIGRWFSIFASRIGDAGSRRLAIIFDDITERKRVEQDARFLSELSELIRTGEDEEQLIASGTRLIGQYFGARRCCFVQTDEASDRCWIFDDYHETLPSIAGDYQLSTFPKAYLEELRAGRICVVTDAGTDPGSADIFESVLAPLGIHSHISVPLVRDGRWAVNLVVATDAPREWQPREIKLFETAAERFLLAIEKLRGERALRESQHQYEALVWTSAQIVWETTAEGEIVEDSPTWREFTGQTVEEWYGWGWLDAVHPDDRENAGRVWRDSVELKIPYEVEYRVRHHRGEWRWTIARGTPLLNKDGSIKKWVGMNIDIHDRKLGEWERERLLEREKELRYEAEKANRLKDEFLATVSHEIRTPMNAILGWSTMALQNRLDEETTRRALEIIERSARNQNQIISDILDVSRIITGKLNLSVQPVHLSSIIEAAVDTVRPAIEAKRIRLEMALETDVEIIMGDADRLQQIFWNLLSNACKFTSEGDRIRISSRYLKDRVEISVADGGSGIEPEFLPFVFDRFRQADGKINRKHGGLGLGLAIVRHLTEMHGGSVEATSDGLGQGSVFTVRLPLNGSSAESSENDLGVFGADSENVSEPPAEIIQELNGLKILVVDNEPDALELAAFILAHHGAQILTAESVDEALTVFEQENPDLLISDIGMPDRDGYELIEEIKKRTREENRQILTVALTAYAREEDRRRALQSGFDAYLPKPIEPASLIEMVISLTKSEV